MPRTSIAASAARVDKEAAIDLLRRGNVGVSVNHDLRPVRFDERSNDECRRRRRHQIVDHGDGERTNLAHQCQRRVHRVVVVAADDRDGRKSAQAEKRVQGGDIAGVKDLVAAVEKSLQPRGKAPVRVCSFTLDQYSFLYSLF